MAWNEGQQPRSDAEIAALFGPPTGAEATAPASQQPGAPVSQPTATYIGFYFWWWIVVTTLLALGSFITLTEGKIGSAFLGAIFTGLSGCYVRYLYRGGRFRMIFIIF